jgi:hypothetical protein
MPVKFIKYHKEVGAAFSMDVKTTIFSSWITFQKIEIIESEYFGRFLLTQAESPMFTPNWVVGIVKKLEIIFPRVHFFRANIPIDSSGYWLFGLASKKYHPLEDFQGDKCHQNKWFFKYYNCDIHGAAFVLPNCVRNYLAST